MVFRGEVENDDFNRLVLRAGLAADEIVVLRAYARYCKQIGFALSQATIEATLAAQPHIARMLVKLFHLRLHPTEHDDDAAAAQVNAVEQALDRVSNLNEDRVLRQLLALIQATLRTNRWRTGVGHSGAPGARRSFLGFKLDSARVPGLPSPRPLVEIFVYSPRFEGIHLRGGKVARGGLRWSDRPEDFRTEVLGLVKAQMVKNTVIVPVGSKGGFVLKRPPPASEREAYLKEGVACYQDYLRALLDLTDNLVAGQVKPPPLVRRLDGDDPYLVVAADKGTATFSDHANAIAAEYGHWLGDAFASGGSVGYDHKAMGITARGAWESVKRHFRELGLDTQSQEFSVVGVGDMSGDVFGNGMLLSRHIRLIAAFDHRHVFIDPTPDAARSFAERERLFKLPRSSWADYDAQLISEGGGVWSRAQKSIPLSPQSRAALGIEADRIAPAELLSAILKAPVDLLYNGGIGTYIKARSESHAEVGDRANDALRINGGDLRCKVVAEGGNLGCTQLGRIEAALAGVRINTDAIDNSAGVDTSDHEVNIKILLGLAVADGEMTEKQRNALLPQMTEDVAAQVLADNYHQTQVLSLMRRLGVAQLDRQARFMRHLEKIGQLDRAIEFLPSDEQIAERKAQGRGLTSPELAVLLAYSKMWLSDELVASDLPEDPWVATALARYFPPLLREKFAELIPRHPLKREIIATHVLNRMVNRVGPTFVHRLTEMTGAQPAQIVRAYLATREVFCFGTLWKRDRGPGQPRRRRGAGRDDQPHARPDHPRHHLVPAPAPPGREHAAADHAADAGGGDAARAAGAGRCRAAASGRVDGRWRARHAGAGRGRHRRAVRRAGHCRDRRIAPARSGRDWQSAPTVGRAPGPATAAPADRGVARRQLLGHAGQDRARRRTGRSAAQHCTGSAEPPRGQRAADAAGLGRRKSAGAAKCRAPAGRTGRRQVGRPGDVVGGTAQAAQPGLRERSDRDRESLRRHRTCRVRGAAAAHGPARAPTLAPGRRLARHRSARPAAGAARLVLALAPAECCARGRRGHPPRAAQGPARRQRHPPRLVQGPAQAPLNGRGGCAFRPSRGAPPCAP